MIHIVGLGGVGFWLTLSLTKSIPVDQIVCWDDDTLEGGHGAERLPAGPPLTRKTDLLLGHLAMVYGLTHLPTVNNRRFSGRLQVNSGDIVVDCTDMAIGIRRRVWSYARRRGATMLRVSYEGKDSVVVVSTGLPLIAPKRGGYMEIPTLALSLVAGGIGAEVVRRYIAKPQPTFTLSFSVAESLRGVEHAQT